MQRFQFRLEKVLKWKQHLERLAELRQSQARRVVDDLQTEIASLREMIDQDAAALLPKMGNAVSAAMWVAGYDHARSTGRILGEAEGRLKQAENRLQEATVQRR